MSGFSFGATLAIDNGLTSTTRSGYDDSAEALEFRSAIGGIGIGWWWLDRSRVGVSDTEGQRAKFRHVRPSNHCAHNNIRNRLTSDSELIINQWLPAIDTDIVHAFTFAGIDWLIAV